MPYEPRTAIRKAAPIRPLRRSSDQLSAIASSVGSMGPRSMFSAVKMAWTPTGKTRSTITILPTSLPSTAPSPGVAHGPDGRNGLWRSRPLPRPTLAAIAAIRAAGPHVDLAAIELVGDIAPLSERVSQRFPVATERVFPGRVLTHQHPGESKPGTISLIT